MPMVIFPSYLVVPPSIWTSERETSFKVGILTCFTVLEFVSGNYSCPSILSVIHMKMSTPRLKAQKIFGVWRQRTTNHKGIWHLKTHLNEIFLSCSLVYSWNCNNGIIICLFTFSDPEKAVCAVTGLPAK